SHEDKTRAAHQPKEDSIRGESGEGRTGGRRGLQLRPARNEGGGMNNTTLHAYGRLVTTPFGLLGTDENALSFALGYTFQQCTPLLQWFLRAIGISGVHQSALHKASIDLQQHRSGEPEQGITDIEVHLPGHFHVIIEAKVGLAVPSIEQCRKYLTRFHDEP